MLEWVGARLRLPVLVMTSTLAMGARIGWCQNPPADHHLWAPNQFVDALAISGNTLYIGGQFDFIGPRTGTVVLVDPSSGAIAPAWPEVSGHPTVVASDGLGGWYVAGWINAVGGLPRRDLAHIRGDRSVEPVSHTFNAEIRDMVASEGIAYVAGAFTLVDGNPRQHLAAFDVRTGRLLDWAPAVNAVVTSLAVLGDAVVIGGGFTVVNGASRSYLASLERAAGTLGPWSPSLNGSVERLCVDQGIVRVAGNFTTAGGITQPRLAAFDAVTGQLTAWRPSVNGPVTAIAVDASRVFLAGEFTAVGGQARAGLAAVDRPNGTVDPWGASFAPTAMYSLQPRFMTLAVHHGVVHVGGAFATIGGRRRSHAAALDAATGAVLDWNPGFGAEVWSLASDGTSIAAAGQFSSAGGYVRENLAAIDLLTGEATDWAPTAVGNPGLAYVRALAARRGKVYVAGEFATINGQPRPGFATLDSATGGLLPALSVGGDATSGYRGVRQLGLRGDTLYLGGIFGSLGGRPRNSLAAIDTRTDAVTDWDPGLVPLTTPYLRGVRALAVDGNTVYVSAYASSIGGRAPGSPFGLAALDPVSGAARYWPVQFDGYGGDDQLSLAGAHGRVYLGGNISCWESDFRESIVALDSISGAFSAWNPRVNGTRHNMFGMSAIAVEANSVYLSGGFSDVGGQERRGLTELDAVSAVATPWNPRPTLSSVDISHLLRHGDHLYAAGVLYQAEWDSYETLVRYPLTVSSAAPECDLIAPAGGIFAIGAAVPIRWTALDDRDVRSVDLFLSRSGPSGPWEPIAVGLVNTGEYLWTVQGPECPSVAHLRVDARDYDRLTGSVVGATPFSIVSSATATLVELERLEDSESGIEISWSLDPERVQGQGTVERRMDVGGDWALVDGEPVVQRSGFSLLDRMVAAGQRYWYRVVAPVLGGGRVTSTPMSITHSGAVVRLALATPSPNPSAGRAELGFEIPTRARVRLGLFDLQGREVARLLDRECAPGRHTARLEAGDVAPGLYLLRLRSGGVEARRKLVLAR